MPVHFLANSLIGPSFTQELPTIIEFDGKVLPKNASSMYSAYLLGGPGDDERDIDKDLVSISSGSSFPCWSAFRTGSPHYAKSTEIMHASDELGFEQNKFDAIWKRMVVHYESNKCQEHQEDLGFADLDMLENSIGSNHSYAYTYIVGQCRMGYEVMCTLHDPGKANCRLNIRMSAAFTLMACLVLKAIYR